VSGHRRAPDAAGVPDPPAITASPLPAERRVAASRMGPFAYWFTGMTNSGPVEPLSGQRCITLFARV
jgi:hypothetical protein